MVRFKKQLTLLLALILLLAPQGVFAREAPTISAKGAIVMDYDSGEVLYEKYPDTPRSAASMTKVMTAYVLLDEAKAGRFSWDVRIPISENARRRSPWDNTPFREQERIGDLFAPFLVASNNQMGIAMAEYVGGGSEARFTHKMNAKARALGIDASYTEVNGLRPNKVTPRAQALLTRSLIQTYPDILEITSQPAVAFRGRRWRSTNKFYRDFQHFGGINGFKTGTASYSGQCLTATREKKGRRFISVVMGSRGKDGRYRDTMAILNYALDYYSTSDWAARVPARAEKLGINTAIHRGLESFQGREAISRGEFTLLMTLTLGLGAGEGRPPFRDVDPNSYYAGAVALAKTRGLIDGYDDGTFRPDQPITREEMAKILHHALGLGDEGVHLPFKDRDKIHPVYHRAVTTLVSRGILKGHGDGRFDPKGRASREEATQMMLNLIDRRQVR